MATMREYERRINDAFLPVTRRTKDEALKKRGSRNGLGRALVSLHARVLADAMQAEPALADVKINAMEATMIEVWSCFHDMEADFRARMGR